MPPTKRYANYVASAASRYKPSKTVSRHPWERGNRRNRATCQPIEGNKGARQSAPAHWVLGHPDLFLNSVGDIHVLPRLLDAANHFNSAPSDEGNAQVLEQQAMEPLFANTRVRVRRSLRIRFRRVAQASRHATSEKRTGSAVL